MSVQSTSSEQKPEKPKTVEILVNNKVVELPDREVTGAEIKLAAGVPSEFKLYDHKGSEITDDQQVRIHPQEKFTAISGQDVS
jgi:hypothetical protein